MQKTVYPDDQFFIENAILGNVFRCAKRYKLLFDRTGKENFALNHIRIKRWRFRLSLREKLIINQVIGRFTISNRFKYSGAQDSARLYFDKFLNRYRGLSI